MEDTKQIENPSAAEVPPVSSPISIPAGSQQEDVVTKGLRFLSTASTEAIGGIAIGLAACTYVVLGRIGLVLIGVMGGVVLHATWETHNVGSIEEARREKSLDIVKRILDQRNAASHPQEEEEDKEAQENSFEGFQPETASALNGLVDVSSLP